jgi:hypothetical protein
MARSTSQPRSNMRSGEAVQAVRADPTISALYGFSGGGYNLRHVLDDLTENERSRIKLVVVLGAPGNPRSVYQAFGLGEVVYHTDPGHMDGPRALLGELVSETDAVQA